MHSFNPEIFLFPFTGHENTRFAAQERSHENTFCFFLLETFHHTGHCDGVDLILPRPAVRIILMGFRRPAAAWPLGDETGGGPAPPRCDRRQPRSP